MDLAAVAATRKYERDTVIVAQRMAQRLAGNSAFVVQPNADVLARWLIPSYVSRRLIARRTVLALFARDFVDFDVLMIENPGSGDIVGGLLTGDRARQDPSAYKMIEQAIAERRLLRERRARESYKAKIMMSLRTICPPGKGCVTPK